MSWTHILLILVPFALSLCGGDGMNSTEIGLMEQQSKKQETVESIVARYGEAARARLKEKFTQAGKSYPPIAVTLLGLKSEKRLDIYGVFEKGSAPEFIFSYPILGTSGVLGPKLREGDKQMPEGFYRVREFEPNSSYHVALRLNYPSDFDKEKGAADGREKLGCDIMIHGENRSIGCLAMGDPASEDLFVLVNDVGIANTEIVMCPFDFRKPPQGVSLPTSPDWVSKLYEDLKNKLMTFKPLDAAINKSPAGGN